MTPLETAQAVHRSLPPGGLFHEKSWRIATRPFPLPEGLDLEKLGYRLFLFQRACDTLYRLSADGRQPAWIAQLLDKGKPSWLVDFQRHHTRAGDIPKIIRPDLVLTAEGVTIAELDSVPGGIGLTAWLAESYASLGFPVAGGSAGMLDGFEHILPGGDILVSNEAATYRPEMEWLAAQLNNRSNGDRHWRVLDTSARSDWQPRLYRFFEMFDLANLPATEPLLAALQEQRLEITPPFKPALEEKLWFALFWMAPLRSFWRQEIGDRAFEALQSMIPYTWLVDPSPLPPHAVLPRLEVQSWREVAGFSQKKRNLILKISGFSEKAWGSRGVVVASDLSQSAWAQALSDALADFDGHPHILQVFHPGRRFDEEFWNPGDRQTTSLRGRVRLCPYYFSVEGRMRLGGALATICPDDKKLLHGMSDAILAPAALGGQT